MRGLARGLAAAAAVLVAGTAMACGGADEPCTTPLGSYHVLRPAGDAPVPVFVYFHGAGGSGRTIHAADFAAALVERGYAVVAPNGLERPASRFGAGWYFRPESPARRDELAFTREVLADLARHGVDGTRVVLTGYSIGGSLVWYLACADADLAAAYAPYAGGFWRPLPTDCNGPVRLLHTHGWRDQTVPLEGRPLRDGAIYQGDIFAGLAVWRTENGCDLLRADEFETEGRWWRRRWTSCAAGALELALWPGGHVPPDAEWAAMAADWYEGLEAPGAMTLAGDMARAARRLEPGDPRVATDTVRLPFDDRHRRRLVVRTAAGERVLVDLPEAARLAGGDRLLLDDGRVLGIEAEAEPVADLFAADLVRLAWHLGNRHTPTAILPDRLRIRRDHVLEAMAARLGARVEHAEAPFDPEAGAYDGGGGHGHHRHD